MRVALVDKSTEPHPITPLALGYIKAQALAEEEIRNQHHVDIHAFRQNESLCSALFALLGQGVPDLIACTCQGWNVTHHIRLAEAIKQCRRETFIVFGGTHVSHNGENLLARYPFIDLVVNGEGEATFQELLRGGIRQDLAQIPGLTYRDGTAIVTTPARARQTELGHIPSPYLEGFMRLEEPDLMAVLETNRGCPYNCAFCYWGGAINTRLFQFPTDRLMAELELLAWSKVPAIYIADANFGILERDWALAEQIVRLRERFGYPRNLFTNWTKNKNRRVLEIAKMLIDGHVQAQVTVAVQSRDAGVLAGAQRTAIHPVDLHEFTQDCRELGVPTYGELIWGLPLETYGTFLKGFNDLRAKVPQVWIYPLFVLPNTDYHKKRQEFGIVTAKLFADADWDVCIQTCSMPYTDYLQGLRFTTAHLGLQSMQVSSVVDLWHALTGQPHAEVVLDFATFLGREVFSAGGTPGAGDDPLTREVAASMNPYEISGRLFQPYFSDPGMGEALVRSFFGFLQLQSDCPLPPAEADYLDDYLSFVLALRPVVSQDEASLVPAANQFAQSSHFRIFTFPYDHTRTEVQMAEGLFSLPVPKRTCVAVSYPAGARSIAQLGFFNTMGARFRGQAEILHPDVFHALDQLQGGAPLTAVADELPSSPHHHLVLVQELQKLKESGKILLPAHFSGS